MGSGAGSHHFAAILQVGNYYKTSCQHTHCDYAIHVVQSKHQHVFVQYHWFTGRLEENHAVRIWEINAGSKFAPSHCYTSSRQWQRSNLPVQRLWQCNPCGATQTSTLVSPTPLVYSKVGRKHMQLEYGNECRFAPSHSFIFKQAIATKQPASIQVVPNCDNATHVVHG